MPRLEVLAGFAAVWRCLEGEMKNVVIKKNARIYSLLEESNAK